MKKHVKNNFCGIVLPTQKNNIFEFNHYMKLDKVLYIIYADIESLIKKIPNNCYNNPEKSSTTKIGKHSLWIFVEIR